MDNSVDSEMWTLLHHKNRVDHVPNSSNTSDILENYS